MNEQEIIYKYTNEADELQFQVVRSPGKVIHQRQKAADGAWVWNLSGLSEAQKFVLYRVVDVKKALSEGNPVYFAEGEKDCETLRALGFVATCNACGAGKMKAQHVDIFKRYQNTKAVIFADNDKAGRDHAKLTAELLWAAGCRRIRIIDFTEMPEKSDVSDWLAVGHSKEELLERINAATDWMPEQAAAIVSDQQESKEKESSAEGKPTGVKQIAQSQRLMELVEEENAVFFHDETNAGYAAVPVEGRREIHAVRSKRFRLWLTRLFYSKAGSPPGSEALRSVQDILEARALFDGAQKKLSLRTAVGSEGAFYYDLGGADWSAVRIDDNGWRIDPAPPILFKRRGNTGPQVVPLNDPEGRGVTRLLDFVNVGNEVDQRLFLVYVCLCTVPEIPHFVLAVTGEKGAGKSFLLRLLRRIIDPAGLELASLPHDKSELALHLSSNYFAAYDNLDNLQGWQSDMLCTAATGGGVSKRELYSDSDEIILKFRHCIGLNGITSFVTRPDLMDRTILIELQRIDETERATEHDIEARFEHARPYIMGGIFDTLATARMLIDNIKTDSLPRMADAARWGAAISAALGYDDGQFFADLRANAGAANDETIRANPVAAAMVALMAGESEWDGTPGELLERLTMTATDEKINVFAKSWPDSAASLSKRLKLVRSNLREAGIELEQYRDKSIQRNRRIRITAAQRVGNDSSNPSNVVGASIFEAFGTQ